ncbi:MULTISPECIES: radical SAM family heme chaperone HemW [unclassified Oleiphilus]|nr:MULTISPECIES: radical SAM family heme chaperone HemW [unclassified Oleiphilus]KZY44855.1 YggW family oxidoreductase [Oleiphilus sp. HI0050]KZY78124.1 YggW family oxidoreductase [Oleiphilus sp. HI0068]KZY83300.1 YggW family oxidoreductase [Oleiphilus sp. HI0069]KZY95925.1 YggW family oxidoreductase [Oleiphilus sp. HI0072]KZZ20054.1 YggW family oxidoreductase [Oleiphilus sp. HI0078]KZZ22328.1 YggW family oxidoreductase [Oleiphilus sp. HI0081]KZZ38236.1 YggW family oxidoreductase [Oleiphilus
MNTLPPLSLYVHIPWCVRKCPYCDFNSHVSAEIPEQAYLNKLLEDLDFDREFAQGRKIESIFFGGGTPSLMSGEFYQRLLPAIDKRLPFAEHIEITLEANPGTTEAKRFQAYAQAGINRLSLGVQSFKDRYLEKLGRIHSASEAMKAIEQAHEGGITNCNIDLMHGLPGQTLDDAMDDIQSALSLGPNHLSWYQLTIEQNTEFYRYPPALPEDELMWDIQNNGLQLLGEKGFQQYEVSAFSKPDFQAKHNLNYWQFGDYLGIGAGAHSKITLLDDAQQLRGMYRYRKTRTPNDYLKAIASRRSDVSSGPSIRVGEQAIPQEDLAFEFMMNVLRLTKGVPASLLSQRTGLELSVLEPMLTELKTRGLMKEEGLCTTDKGLLFLNTILEGFTEN